ncbi:hypothetical protein HVW51_27245 (plasmid) [Escherichia coli]|uniref:Uncharacterized protein n=2 Tax=Escherichia coli TaxID=562 RepID=A0A3Q8G877_ECOLX|nr:hypothetical protein [Escherichia coli]AWU47923.1 hypothetical protein [Escherichia coli]MBA8465247.1 hypothetical protein [Escherichia coli]QOC75840.1 hypothetical protein p10068_00249 [Escherichia coli]QOC76120.1 hypothetical protein p97974-2T_00280 [Escherichia coli]QOC76397.1 hypothetical protein p99063_00277 [Escherichia coli]
MVRDQHSSMAWRLRGLNATLSDQLPHSLAIKGVKCHGTRPAFLHGLAIKGVKCHGTRPASRHALAIKGVKCHAKRPASPWPGD